MNRRVPEGLVALTFDDGPHPESTGRILDVLAELDVSATFFCVGRNARAHPDLVARAITEGHVIGSHSMTHPHPKGLALRVLAQEYREGQQAVAAAAGRPAPLFRPPHGHLTVRSAAMLHNSNLSTWLWTVDPQDWRPDVRVQELVRSTERTASGDVILLHDWVEQATAPQARNRAATIAALPAIVRNIRDKGLAFAVLPS